MNISLHSSPVIIAELKLSWKWGPTWCWWWWSPWCYALASDQSQRRLSRWATPSKLVHHSPRKNSVTTFQVKLLLEKVTNKQQSFNFSRVTFGKFHQGIESNDFMPWNKQNPELFEGDIMQSKTKNAILNSNGRWPNGRIPYIISASYSMFVFQVPTLVFLVFILTTLI